MEFDEGYDAWIGNLPYLGSEKPAVTSFLPHKKEWAAVTVPASWQNHQWRPADAPPVKPEKNLVTPKSIALAFGLPVFILILLYFAPLAIPAIFLAILAYAVYLVGHILGKLAEKKDR